MGREEKTKVAIVGADREGLETLRILNKDRDVSVRALIDPDHDALGFKLEKYGYTFSEDLNILLSNHLRDLTTLQDIDLIIDTIPRKYHGLIYELRPYPLDIMNGAAAKFLWELKDIENVEYRRPMIKSRIQEVSSMVKEYLKTIPLASLFDEYCPLILRTAYLGTDATSARLTVLDMDATSRIKIDINVDFRLVVEKECSNPSLESLEEEERIFKTIMKDRVSLRLKDGEIQGWEGITVIPVMDGNILCGIIWLFYRSVTEDTINNDESFISSMLPDFKSMIVEALNIEKTRISSVCETLSKVPLEIIESDQPVGTKLKEVNQAIYRLLGADDSNLYIKDPSSGDLVLQTTTFKFPFSAGNIHVRKGHGILHDVLKRKRPIFLSERQPFSERYMVWEDSPAILYIPLIVRKRGVGIITMEFTKTHYITQDTLNALFTISSHLASAIESDIERHRMTQKILKLSAVNEEGIELLSTTDIQKVLSLATSLSSMLFDSEVSICRLVEDGKLEIKSTYGIHNGENGRILMEVDSGICDIVSQTGIPVIINDVSEYTDISLPQTFPYKTAIVVPIFVDKHLFGTLSLYNRRAIEPFGSIFFTEDDRELIDRFTPYVAKGITNARRFSETQSLVTIDDETGLRNERYLQIRFPEEIRRAKRFNRSVSLIFFEVRPFDAELIREIARLVQETFRYIDVIVRLKEAKFAALLPDTGEGVRNAVKRLSANFEQLKNKRPDIALYAGFSTYPDDSENMQELIRKASRLHQY